MAIRTHPNAEPFSQQARPGAMVTSPILAQSQAGQLLRKELGRYCAGQVRGRSFLIAGHRGSGKTMLVDHALLEFQQQALNGTLKLKPMPVHLHGPTLFDDDDEASPVGGAERRSAKGMANNLSVTLNMADGPRAAAGSSADAGPGSLKNRVLIQVVQALHQSVAREFSARFHHHASHPPAERVPAAASLGELAARFQIELTEAPSASRLHEFWQQAGLAVDGLLFDPAAGRGPQQGLRELVALTGVTHVHQRISGQLVERDQQHTGASRTTETTHGLEAKWAELVKPVTAVASGAAVAAASASTGGTVESLVLGLLAALGASLVFRVSALTRVHRERKLDRTFVPDLSIKTLHRVMPELIERLFAAGLAPVFVVDELDKVNDLDSRIYPLIHGLKKLFAEISFTCLLVDRGFYERLHVREEQEKQPR